MDALDFSIIIVNYNTADMIGPCLESLGRDDSITREVFVIDNASTDGSAESIRKKYPWVHLTVNPQNRGFAAANNQVLPLCQGRYLLYLNPDTRLAGSGVLRACIRFMDEHPRIGLAGTRLLNPDGSLQESFSYQYPGQKFAQHELDGLLGGVACVMGASMVARTDLIRKLGGFDEEFVLYGEDQDLCLRIRQSGYKIGYIEDAYIIHYGGQSERYTHPLEIWKKKTWAEYLFYRKHYHAKTVAKILMADWFKAHFRLFTLYLAAVFTGDGGKTDGKREKYKAVCETLRMFNWNGKI